MRKLLQQFGLWLSLVVYGGSAVAPMLTKAPAAASLTITVKAVAVEASAVLEAIPAAPAAAVALISRVPAAFAPAALAGAVAIVAAIAEDAGATTIHGLNWDKDNCAASSDIRLKWDGSNLLSRTTHTAIWRYNPHQQNGYYAVAWHSPNSGTWTPSYSYGTHPWPGDDCSVNVYGEGTSGNASSAVHCWEQAGLVDGHDWLATAGTNPGYTVVTDRWYTQVRRVQAAASGTCSGGYRHEFFPDYVNFPTRVIITCTASPITGAGASPAFYFGGSDWSTGSNGECSGVAGTNNETLAGKLRGIQLYSAALSDADVATEAANTASNAAQTSAGQAAVWYINQDPIPTDVTDKSGAGHSPSWVNANRPAQWDSTFGSSNPPAGLLLRGGGF